MHLEVYVWWVSFVGVRAQRTEFGLVGGEQSTGDNEYVYHCHILEHEEHDMMRPLIVQGVNPAGVIAWPTEPIVSALLGGTVVVNLTGGAAPYGVTAPAGFTGTAVIAGNTLTITFPAGAVAQNYVFTVTDAMAGDTATVTVTAK
ncbi:MAG: multicopper oxidase domain-containing protein [Terriglobales bacterium]